MTITVRYIYHNGNTRRKYKIVYANEQLYIWETLPLQTYIN